jgi:hypothetical protein
MLVEDRERQVTEQRRENPALGRAGDRVPLDAIPREDAGLEERLHQDQDPLVCDSGPQPVKDADMRDFIEARLDVALHDPLIGAGREDVNLGDRVMDPASGAEAVAARLEVRLQDRLEHRLEGGLHHPVAYGRDAQPAIYLPPRLGIITSRTGSGQNLRALRSSRSSDRKPCSPTTVVM